ncbi:MAG: hypothetical protein JNL98_11375 [Bryobacterales bacterium]|nr:hypothetical protein [Bryobacterales bacterium]
MARAFQPGCSFAYIWDLVQKNNGIIAPTPFTPELMIAIFWEESLFNNIAQVDTGTAVGYGQVEPAEFYRFNARNLQSQSPAMRAMGQDVQRKGYLIHNLPPVAKSASGKTQLNGALTDEQAVQVAMALVRDMHERKRSRKGILEGYAGVGFQGDQPDRLKGNGRQHLIDGWLRCEAKLIGCSKSDADAVIAALQEAKPFNQVAEFRAILFPHAAPSAAAPSAAAMPPSVITPGAVPTGFSPAARVAPAPGQCSTGPGGPRAGSSQGQGWVVYKGNTAYGSCHPGAVRR